MRRKLETLAILVAEDIQGGVILAIIMGLAAAGTLLGITTGLHALIRHAFMDWDGESDDIANS
jgi:hypothetical protein